MTDVQLPHTMRNMAWYPQNIDPIVDAEPLEDEVEEEENEESVQEDRSTAKEGVSDDVNGDVENINGDVDDINGADSLVEEISSMEEVSHQQN